MISRIGRRAVRGLLLALALGVTAEAAHAEYALSSGDMIEITVFRVPELSRQVTVDVDGRIALPPLGLVQVRGHTLEEVSATIERLLGERDLQPDAQVTVGLTSARPIFVGGDVVTPGSFPYQPELSVRRAIALAGGLGRLQGQSLAELPSLLGDREVLTDELARLQAREARLTAELAGRDSLALGGADLALPAEVVELETRQLKADLEERAQQRAHLARTVELIQTRIDTLLAQQATQEQVLTAQGDELSRLREIQDRGLTNLARVQIEQRAYENMQERAAATAADVVQGRSQLEQARHELDRFDARQRAELERQLEETQFGVRTGAARLTAAEDRLAYAGFTDGRAPEVTIYRFVNGQETVVAATEATPLEPGDMVGVTLPPARLMDGDNSGVAGGSPP
jgi:hypothetical protein